MHTYDVKKAHPELYRPKPSQISLVDVPPFTYLAVDGHGNPNTADTYRHAVEALYTLTYGVRAIGKKNDRVHVVAPLEGLWWSDDLTAFTTRAKDDWQWTMMIHQPDYVTGGMVDSALEVAAKKKPNPALALVRLERITEGPAVQALHIGPYDDEAPLIEQMHQWARERGHQLRGKHHEIYLSDPRKVEPAKLKTILRQPVTPAR